MFKIAILGCGLIGETHAHMLAQLGNPPMLFADKDRRRAERLAARYSGRATDRAEDAIHSDEIEAVYICTYHDTHAPLASLAASAGKHLFIEKPMAITEHDGREISNAVRANGVQCMTGFKFHYMSLTRKAKELLKSPQVLSAEVIERRWPDDSWANDPLKGGGNVLSQGCHAVELLLDLAQARPVRIFAEGGNLRHPSLGPEFRDTMCATIAFENEAVASLRIADAGEMPHDGKFSIQAMNGIETVHLYDRLKKLSYYDGHEHHTFEGEEDGFLNEDREFLRSLAERRQPETNEVHGLRAEMILLRGIESIRTHMPQSLLDLP